MISWFAANSINKEEANHVTGNETAFNLLALSAPDLSSCYIRQNETSGLSSAEVAVRFCDRRERRNVQKARGSGKSSCQHSSLICNHDVISSMKIITTLI